jgi:hypothetical protein
MPPRQDALRDLGSAAGLALLALGYLAANRRYPLDSLTAPGPGVFPLAVGLLLLLLAGIQAVRTVWRWVRREADAVPRGAPGEPRHPLLMVGLLAAFGAAIGVIGFLPASCGLALLSSRLLGARGWWGPVALAVGVTAAVWALFVVWLGVPLPAGPLG